MPAVARRVAAVVILLAVAAAGLRARGAFSAAGSPAAVAAHLVLSRCVPAVIPPADAGRARGPGVRAGHAGQ